MRNNQLRALIVCLMMLFSGTATAADKVTPVEFWFGETVDAYVATMQSIVDQFNATHAGITVNMIVKAKGTAFQEALTLATIGGVPPDLVYTDAFSLKEMVLTQDILQPISKLLPPQTLQEYNRDFLPGPKGEAIHAGDWYVLPFRTDTRGMYLNVDLFEKAGLNGQVGPKDIAELDVFARKLTRRGSDGTIEVLGFAPNRNNFATELPWIWAFGGEFFNYDQNRLELSPDPTKLAVLDWILSYASVYGPKARSSAGDFRSGKVAMHINSTSRLTQYKEEYPDLRWYTSPIPALPDVPRFSLGFALGAAMPAGAPHPEATVEFLLYLFQPETQALWYRNTHSLPTRFESLRRIGSLITDPRERVLVDLLPVTRIMPPMYPTLSKTWEVNLDKMRQNELTPLEVIENTRRSVEPLYRELFRY